MLHITLDGKIITSNLYEIGTLSNGLLPLYYENEKKHEGSFSYLDCSTNNIFPIDNVRWISGFHFEGNNLNYIDHDYRTNPLKNFMEYHLICFNKYKHYLCIVKLLLCVIRFYICYNFCKLGL